MVVFDASTLILLAKVDLLEDVAKEYEIVVTPVVEQESTLPDTPDAKLIARLIGEDRIKVKDVAEGSPDIKRIQKDFNLAPGEASSLWLARRLGVVIATDDGPAIKAAKVLGVGFATAIHFIIRCYETGEVSKRLALAKLEKLEKVGRYSLRIIEDAKRRIMGGKK